MRNHYVIVDSISIDKMKQYNLSRPDVLYYVENVSYVDDELFRYLAVCPSRKYA